MNTAAPRSLGPGGTLLLYLPDAGHGVRTGRTRAIQRLSTASRQP